MSLVTPYRLGFFPNDDEFSPIEIFELCLNSLFFFDIVFIFFTPYYDENEALVIDRIVLIQIKIKLSSFCL